VIVVFLGQFPGTLAEGHFPIATARSSGHGMVQSLKTFVAMDFQYGAVLLPPT
jgi:hypothetical protein